MVVKHLAPLGKKKDSALSSVEAARTATRAAIRPLLLLRFTSVMIGTSDAGGKDSGAKAATVACTGVLELRSRV